MERFHTPGADYRAHPFRSWNDKLEENELRRQVAEIAKSGQGGFFMHAGSGLKTPYLSDEWFDMTRACTDEAAKQGINAWCYDELGWPSGSAGGSVPAPGEEYKMRWLRLRDCVNGETAGEVIAFYGVNGNSYRCPTFPHHIDLSGIYAACARVSVNGVRGGLVAWGNKCEDITDRLQDGINRVSIELTVGNRNLLGPHHMPKAGIDSPGPGDFVPSIHDYKWKKRYAFGKAGLGD